MRTQPEESLNNRVALAVFATRDAHAAWRALAAEAALTRKQAAWVEKQAGHLEGLTEALDWMRPR